MQRIRNTNVELKKTVNLQNQIIKQCLQRIVELETHIVTIDPHSKIQPFISVSENSLRTNLKHIFKTPPPIISFEKIEKITDKYFLIDMEAKYDKFIEKNLQLLLLYDFIEDLLEIRDAIILRIGRLNRQERMNKM